MVTDRMGVGKDLGRHEIDRMVQKITVMTYSELTRPSMSPGPLRKGATVSARLYQGSKTYKIPKGLH